MSIWEKLNQIEQDTMAQLKDFQCATVERIDELFRNGQNRVLIADEVGLGENAYSSWSYSQNGNNSI